MGLDMYLYKVKRYEDATPKDVENVESYLDWKAYMLNNDREKDITFEQWSGIDSQDLNMDAINFYTELYKPFGDYGYYTILNEVGYWRKANQIHNWFVRNIQDGIDDCEVHREVTREDLDDLLNACNNVLSHCHYTGEDEDGNSTYDVDRETIEDILPTSSGFFFGSDAYDSYYIEQVSETRDMIQNVLSSTDFNTEMIFYRSSW